MSDPLDTAPLFPRLHAELVALLRGLEPADWERTDAGRRLAAGARGRSEVLLAPLWQARSVRV